MNGGSVKKIETPKSPVDQIFDGLFARLRKTGELDEQVILKLEQLLETGKLSNLQSLKAALADSSEG